MVMWSAGPCHACVWVLGVGVGVVGLGPPDVGNARVRGGGRPCLSRAPVVVVTMAWSVGPAECGAVLRRRCLEGAKGGCL